MPARFPVSHADARREICELLSCGLLACAPPFCALLHCGLPCHGLRCYGPLSGGSPTCALPSCALRSFGWSYALRSGALLQYGLLFLEQRSCALWFYGLLSFWLPSYALETVVSLTCGPRCSGPRFCASLFSEVLFCGRRRCGWRICQSRSCALFQVFSDGGSCAWVTIALCGRVGSHKVAHVWRSEYRPHQPYESASVSSAGRRRPSQALWFGMPPGSAATDLLCRVPCFQLA